MDININKRKLIDGGVENWQAFLMCKDAQDVDRMVQRLQTRVDEMKIDGIRSFIYQADLDTISEAPKAKAALSK